MKLFPKLSDYGQLSLGLLMICTVSGIVLALPYDVSNAYSSLALNSIINFPFAFIRAAHYWSAQLLLIFVLLHLFHHINNNEYGKLTKGKWFRLVASLAVLFYAMLSGFLLKADAESLQAANVFEGLLLSVPLIGGFLKSLFFGTQANLLMVYVHHITTATLIIWIITFEHSRQLFANVKHYVLLLPLTIFLSLLFIPQVMPLNADIIKSPWYLLGLQELLHWISIPVWGVVLTAVPFILLYFIRKEKITTLIKKLMLLMLGLYLLLSIVAFTFRFESWEFRFDMPSAETFGQFKPFWNYSGSDSLVSEIPVIMGRPEGCMACHSETEGFTESHKSEALGCYSCHLGNPLTLDKELAHKDMLLVPGSLENISKSCGQKNCHSTIADRVSKSIMNTMSGVISVDKYVFGEIHSPEGLYTVNDIENSNADVHLRQLCVSCHLSNPKEKAAPIDQLSRGGGCVACHLSYSKNAKEELEQRRKGVVSSNYPRYHTQISLPKNDDACFGCHSRSGRISTHYKGWYELHDAETVQDTLFQLQDERYFTTGHADIHYEKGLLCIDCHNSYEIMGDGNLYQHKEQALNVRCEDCHSNESPVFAAYDSLDFETKMIIDLRKINRNHKFLLNKKNYAFANVIEVKDSIKLISKKDGRLHPLKSPAFACNDLPGHKTLSCVSCHTKTTTQCVGCHTSFDKNAPAWDHKYQKEVKGGWNEQFTGIYYSEPTLGMIYRNEDYEIYPFSIGMTILLDQPKDKENKRTFSRYFAPAFSHTVSSKGRSCKSCHHDPIALGYGKGMLFYKIEINRAYWMFDPEYAKTAFDLLPEDAWIDFLKEPLQKSTRPNAAPLTLSIQKKMLLVGACLNCHSETEPKIKNIFHDFENYKSKISPKCVLPNNL